MGELESGVSVFVRYEIGVNLFLGPFSVALVAFLMSLIKSLKFSSLGQSPPTRRGLRGRRGANRTETLATVENKFDRKQ